MAAFQSDFRGLKLLLLDLFVRTDAATEMDTTQFL